VYEGDAFFNSSSDSVAHTVDKASTITVVTSNNNPSLYKQVVIFTATVSVVPPGTGTPTGMVSLYIDGVWQEDATLTLASGGKAIFTPIGWLSAGDHTITAEYFGDVEYNVSPPAQAIQRVSSSSSPHGYYITASSNQGATISPEGIVSASGGSNVTFLFSAASVKVDDKPLSQEDIAKGYYTFRYVQSNHTIEASGVSQAAITLTISVKEGNGRAEYSLNGSSFMLYTSTVSVPAESLVVVRALADEGYVFKEWGTGTTMHKTSELSFKNVTSSLHLDLYFASEDSPSDSSLLWWVAGLALLFLLLFLLILLWRRRRDDEEAMNNP
jgi:hypothetical protein